MKVCPSLLPHTVYSHLDVCGQKSAQKDYSPLFQRAQMTSTCIEVIYLLKPINPWIKSWFSLVKIKKTSFKMDLGSPEGGMSHPPTIPYSLNNQQEKGRIRLTLITWELHFLLLRKRRKIPTCPRNNTLTTACSQWETTKTSNSCSSLVNFCSKQPSPISS